jgi:hypothetical protein
MLLAIAVLSAECIVADAELEVSDRGHVEKS